MSEIRVLDEKTIDKIAAGEVIERPASVVKELLENALDAGASAVSVEIRGGGIDYIRVTDNGSGIPAGEVRTAFLPHATSKLRTIDDLKEIRSLGFRGEALPSIAAVSQVEMLTKTAGSLMGIRYVMEGGYEQSLEEAGVPDGTTFIVRNLFFHTPARRKFLKTASTEAGYVTALVEELAMARPDISFKYAVNGHNRLVTRGNGDLKEVIYRIYGRDIVDALIPVRFSRDGMEVTGCLAKPVIARASRSMEIYYVNGRRVRDRVVEKGLEDGYSGFLMQHRFPFVVLKLSVPPELLDVNVHPRKTEVRFSEEALLYELVRSAVSETLSGREFINRVSFDRSDDTLAPAPEAPAEAPEPFEGQKGKGGEAREAVLPEPGILREETVSLTPLKDDPVPDRLQLQEEKYSLTSSPQEEKHSLTSSLQEEKCSLTPLLRKEKSSLISQLSDGKNSPVFPLPEGKSSLPSQDKDPLHDSSPLPEGNDSLTLPNEDPLHNGLKLSEEKPSLPLPEEEPVPGSSGGEAPVQLDLFEERILSREAVREYRIVGQVFETYWIIEYRDSMLLIDQHAAHEKVMYERFMKRFRERTVTRQLLSPPKILTLSGLQRSILERYMERFTEMGFEIEPFGGNDYAIRAVPEELLGLTDQELFFALLDELSASVPPGEPGAIHDRIATMACRAAVKGSSRLSIREAEELIDEMLSLRDPYNCPHGRPTMIRMTKRDMEKRFRRVL